MSEIITEAMIERAALDVRKVFYTITPGAAELIARTVMASFGLAAEVERLTTVLRDTYHWLSGMSFTPACAAEAEAIIKQLEAALAASWAEFRVAELERAASGLAEAGRIAADTLKSVLIALPVLRAMCGAANLRRGRDKAEEMIGWTNEALARIAELSATPTTQDDGK